MGLHWTRYDERTVEIADPSFRPGQEYAVVRRRLPHWSQAGTISFLTWRTWDSIPERVLQTWLAERGAWLARHGFDNVVRSLRERKADRGAIGLHLRQTQLARLGADQKHEFQRYASNRWNEHLDACHGECVLRRPELSQIVADSLLHFDGSRYELTDFVVMPNHVHVLVAFPDENWFIRLKRILIDGWHRF